MNREIKFRCWDKESLKYRYDSVPCVEEWWDSDCWDDSEQALEDPYVYFSPIFTHRLVWQQYTGLRDKNGKEIYEGDIVTGEEYTSCRRPSWMPLAPSLVSWDDRFACFQVENVGGIPMRGTESRRARDLEVIGNIFETPDLLKAS